MNGDQDGHPVLTDAVQSCLRELAESVWWKSPDNAMRFPRRVATQFMRLGGWPDVVAMVDAVGEDFLRNFSATPKPANWMSSPGATLSFLNQPILIQDRADTLSVLVASQLASESLVFRGSRNRKSWISGSHSHGNRIAARFARYIAESDATAHRGQGLPRRPRSARERLASGRRPRRRRSDVRARIPAE